MLPHKEKDPLSLGALIGANLIPLAGVFFFRWDISFIVLLYWLENLIVGFYNILKMATVKMKAKGANLHKLFVIPFFCIHYGGFCAVHGVFLTVFFKIGTGSSPLAGSSQWWGPLVFLQLLFSVIAKLWASRPPEMIWAVVGLFVSHGVSFVENYILGGEYGNIDLQKLMRQPYQRIIVMHLAILAGGIFVMQMNSPIPLLIILITLKIFFDLHLHNKSHKQEQDIKQAGKKHSSPNGEDIPG
jgi:uncharacterized membrane protein